MYSIEKQINQASDMAYVGTSIYHHIFEISIAVSILIYIVAGAGLEPARPKTGRF